MDAKVDRPPARPGVLRSIRTRLIVGFILLFVLVQVLIEVADIWGLPLMNQPGRLRHRVAETFAGLELVADLHKDYLERSLGERRGDLTALAENRGLRMYVARLKAALAGSDTSGLSAEEFGARVAREENSELLAELLDTIAAAYGVYQEILIADAADGRILVSTRRQDVGGSIADAPYFHDALKSKDLVVSEVSVCARVGQPVLHFCRAIPEVDLETGRPHRGNPAAVLVVGFSPEAMFGPIIQTRRGLGQTGEALLVDQHVRTLMSLRHPLADGSRAELLRYEIMAEPAQRAARGLEGTVESLDYRGELVLAAHRFVAVAPGVGWGLVIKRDRAELLAPIQQAIFRSLVISALGAALLVLLAVLVGRSLTRPLAVLSAAAARVSRGDLAARAIVASRDEVGFLAATFNDMVERVQAWYCHLEEESQRRAMLLEKVGSDLAAEIAVRRRAEQDVRHLATVVESSDDAILSGDLEGRIASWNNGAERLYGYEAEEVLGESIALITPEARRKELAAILSTITKGESVKSLETIRRRKDGGLVDVSLTVSPIRDGAGKVVGGAVVARDITERKRVEEELARYRTHLEELVAQRTKDLEAVQEELLRKERLATLGQLIGTVSHELRNPLGTVRTSLFSVAERLRGKELGVERSLERAERAIDRCNSIIEELLDYSRVRSPKKELTTIDSWLGEVFDECTVPVGIAMSRRLVSGAELNIDRERLRRAVLNVLTNAWQAVQETDRPEGRITVETRAAGGRWEIRVQDDGAGIVPEAMSKLLEPLYSTRSFGVGLGLCIVKQIMEQHEGGVEVESERGRGTTVTLWLPMPGSGGS